MMASKRLSKCLVMLARLSFTATFVVVLQPSSFLCCTKYVAADSAKRFGGSISKAIYLQRGGKGEIKNESQKVHAKEVETVRQRDGGIEAVEIQIESNQNLIDLSDGAEESSLSQEADSDDISSNKREEKIVSGGSTIIGDLELEDGNIDNNCFESVIDTESDVEQSDSCSGTEQDSILMSVSERRSEAESLRKQAKLLHDCGDMEEAAHIFREAGEILNVILDMHLNEMNSDDSLMIDEAENFSTTDLKDLADEAAACHLHEALCQLKNNDANESLITCNKVLNDATSNDTFSGMYRGISLSSSVRSRAFHRRAKCKLALSDHEGALSDARSAAFLGDRAAVSLYGKLLRQNGRNSDIKDDTGTTKLDSSLLELVKPPSSSSIANSDASNPAAGFESFLPFLSGMPTGDPLDALKKSYKEGKGLEKSISSIGSSVDRYLSSEKSRQSLCDMVNKFGTRSSVTQIASLAGLPLSEAHVSRISEFCTKLTPQKVEKIVLYVKRLIKISKLGRKAIKLTSILWQFLPYILLIAWIRRSIEKPKF